MMHRRLSFFLLLLGAALAWNACATGRGPQDVAVWTFELQGEKIVNVTSEGSELVVKSTGETLRFTTARIDAKQKAITVKVASGALPSDDPNEEVRFGKDLEELSIREGELQALTSRPEIGVRVIHITTLAARARRAGVSDGCCVQCGSVFACNCAIEMSCGKCCMGSCCDLVTQLRRSGILSSQ